MKRSIGLAAVGLIASFGCLAKEPMYRENVTEVSARVEAIDPATRRISMQGPGGPMSIVAGPEVRNFEQIHVGDQMVVKYYQAIAAEITKSKATPTTQADAGAVVAPLGAKPGAAVVQQISTTVVIESVDTSFDTVSFKLPDGTARTTAVETPQGKKFIRTLKKGDRVDVTYTDAVAVAVVPGKS